MALNAAWHRTHPMPPRAGFDERVAWHMEHARECGCRPVPARLAEQMRERGIPVPRPRR